MRLTLHNYFRSSTSTRLRAALNLKGLAYDYVAYSLRDGAHRSPGFLEKNPHGLVPVLERPDGTCLTQSLAIIEWLDETHPEPPLLPGNADGRARVRALSYAIACEVHPLNNLRVLNHLRSTFGADDNALRNWFTHWVTATFEPFDRQLADDPATGTCCHGDAPTLADLCLYAQVWNNRRFDIPLETYPTIARIFAHLDTLSAFRDAAPSAQPDAA